MHLERHAVAARLDSRVAVVLAQLAPIASRRALLDSYRRESICLTVPVGPVDRVEERVLDLAYSLRWAELDPDDGLVDIVAMDLE